jgi:uncharacterized protein YjbJ (UPF0337 family)
MSKRLESSGAQAQAQASGGGFSSRSGAAGFLVSLKSLFWPVGGAPDASPPTMAPIRTGPLRSLPGMPRPVSARAEATPATPDAHPLRRIAGSAGRWKQRLGEAKQAWPLASLDELIATDGHVQKLADLVQECYGLTHEAAELRVRKFLGPRDAGV